MKSPTHLRLVPPPPLAPHQLPPEDPSTLRRIEHASRLYRAGWISENAYEVARIFAQRDNIGLPWHEFVVGLEFVVTHKLSLERLRRNVNRKFSGRKAAAR